MFQRHKLEKEEGKAYNEPGVSSVPVSVFVRELKCPRSSAAGLRRDESAEQKIWNASRLELSCQYGCIFVPRVSWALDWQYGDWYQELICVR